MKVRPDSRLLAECIQRAGWVRGANLGRFVQEWQIAESDAGHVLTVADFIAWWNGTYSERTIYYRLRDLRGAFPELGDKATPRDVLLLVAGEAPAYPRAEAAGQ